MTERLLDGLRVLDLGGDPSARAGRVLGDLGADVVRAVPPAGDPLSGTIALAWNAGKQVVRVAADSPELASAASQILDAHLDQREFPGAVIALQAPSRGRAVVGGRIAHRATTGTARSRSGVAQLLRRHAQAPDVVPGRCP